MNSNVSVASRYTILAADLSHEVEIKRSRFITYLYRVSSEPTPAGTLPRCASSISTPATTAARSCSARTG